MASGVMMKRVLVTGGSGMIGTYVARRLLAGGHRVASFDVRELPESARFLLGDAASGLVDLRGGVDVWGDIVAAFRRFEPEIVIHIAAVVNPALLARSPELSVKINFQGTVNMLEACRHFGIERFVYASSIAVLPGIKYEPVDVEHPIFRAGEGPGASFYSAAKVASEAYCWAYHQSYAVDFMIVRPSAVYGFGMQNPIFIKPMVENAVNGLPTRFDSGRDFPRDYTHAADVAQLLCRAALLPARDVRDRVFYGATGRPLTTPARIREAILRHIPGADIEIGEGLSEADRLEIRYRGVLDISNARAQLGYEPEFADIEAGVAEYLATYRSFVQRREERSQ